MMNSVSGYLGVHEVFSNLVYARDLSKDDEAKLLDLKIELADRELRNLNDKQMRMLGVIGPNLDGKIIALHQKQSRFELNPVFSGFITSYSRRSLLSSMMNLQKNGGTVIYGDTDSVLCTVRKEGNKGITLSDELGDWKSECSSDCEIIAVLIVSPKVYCYVERNKKTGQITEHTKSKGVHKKSGKAVYYDSLTAFAESVKKDYNHIIRNPKAEGVKGNISFGSFLALIKNKDSRLPTTFDSMIRKPSLSIEGKIDLQKHLRTIAKVKGKLFNGINSYNEIE